MRIVVLGATGLLGQQIVKVAAGQGHALNVVVRDPGRFSAPAHTSVEIVEGNVLDAAVLERAVRGADAVACSLGGPPQGTAVPEAERLQHAVRALVEVMASTGTTRLVFVSAWGVGESRKNATLLFNHVIRPLMVRDEYADKELQESIVRRTSLQWTIARPTVLTTAEPGGYKVGPDLRFPIWNQIVPPRISRADVAHFVIDEIERPRFTGQAVLVTGR